MPVATAFNCIRFELSGPGDIVATDNGDPADLEAFVTSGRRAYSGMALVIVRARAVAKGLVTLTAQSAGLTTAQTTIHVQ